MYDIYLDAEWCWANKFAVGWQHITGAPFFPVLSRV